MKYRAQNQTDGGVPPALGDGEPAFDAVRTFRPHLHRHRGRNESIQIVPAVLNSEMERIPQEIIHPVSVHLTVDQLPPE